MTEWGVVQVIITIVGLGATIGIPLAKLVATMTRLDVAIRETQKDSKEYRQRNSDTHARIFDEIKGHEGQLLEHTKKISVLEGKQDGCRKQ